MKLFITLVLAFLSAAVAEKDSGEVVFITGASSGIGYATAKYLAGQGYKVALTARRKKKLEAAVAEIKAAGGEAMAVALDVVDELATVDAISLVEARLGPINHFFLNAGVFTQGITNGEGMDAFPMDWAKKTFDINVIGVLNGFKHGIKAVRRAEGKKSITVVSSIAGSMNRWMFGDLSKMLGADFTNYGPYAMTKAAIDMLTRMGSHYKHEGIRVYNLKPGVFSTEMVAHEAAVAYGGSEDAFAGFNPAFPGITGNPIYIAQALEHLMDDTTLYVPGQNIIIDNDATCDAQAQYETMETPTQNSFGLARSQLRGLDGGEYKCKDERICAKLAAEAQTEL